MQNLRGEEPSVEVQSEEEPKSFATPVEGAKTKLDLALQKQEDIIQAQQLQIQYLTQKMKEWENAKEPTGGGQKLQKNGKYLYQERKKS